MAIMLYYATVFTPTEVIERGAVVISDDGRIAYVGPMEDAPRTDGLRLDLRGRIVVPGFIDVHVHGGNGITFGESDQIAGDLAAYSKWVASAGVTGFLCSISAPHAEALVQMVRAYADALDAGTPGAEALGLHLEGPFLSKEKKGAFNPAWLRQPAMDEAEAVLQAGRGWIRQMTLAPELPGAQEVAALFRAAGVVVSMGHTNADYELASAALRGNFTHVTHTFNAQRGFQHREPGVFGAIMTSDEVTAELIADTVHVHPGAMKMLIRCLGTDRVVLITDAMAGAGLPDGTYELVGHTVIVKEGRATLPDGTLAGSTATLDQCVRNVHQTVGVPLLEAVKMASLNPARAMGFADRLGSIAVGKDASLAVIDKQANVYLTLVKGRIVYSRL
ncbi:MAG: N-acetylglucosamine-6-phosphate deacetylase [Chloroflexi bacterium]|nr:N-acetylglucosamine-6-phosphate deacetylase [Chloroflexota bacterium]